MPDGAGAPATGPRIGVFGDGALGVYLAARLHEGGANVFLAGRRDRRAAAALAGPRPAVLPECRVLAVAQQPPGGADLAVVAVKRFHSAALSGRLPALLADGASVLTLQNGVDAQEDFAAIGCPVHAGTVRVSASREEARTVYSGEEAMIELPAACRGDLGVMSFASALSAAECSVRFVEDIDSALWRKLAFVASYGGVCAATRRTVGEVRGSPDLALLVRLGFEEAAAVAAASAVAGDELLADSLMDAFERLPAAGRPSLLNDVLCGRPLETPWLSGALSGRAARLGLASPVHDWLAVALADVARQDSGSGSTGQATRCQSSSTNRQPMRRC